MTPYKITTIFKVHKMYDENAKGFRQSAPHEAHTEAGGIDRVMDALGI